MPRLTTTDHNRDIAGLTYVYPVISRRAGGLSIGINFNINNACNWRCVYCQVPDLVRGGPPPLDLALLHEELVYFLEYVLKGRFFDDYQVPPEQREIKDIAISGNGEPTSIDSFAEAIDSIGTLARQYGIFPDSHFVLISNGSLMHQAKVQAGLKGLNRFAGEVWFKVDRGSEQGREVINGCRQGQARLLENIKTSSDHCLTRLQSCVFDYAAQPWKGEDIAAYLALLKQIHSQTFVRDVLLYSLARPSCQPEAGQLQALDQERLQALAEEIKALGFAVKVSV